MEIENRIQACHLCGDLPKLVEGSLQVGNTPFIIIGESPAKDGWIVSKRAFYSGNGTLQATGRVLQRLLQEIGYSIENVYFTECCKCIISDRKVLARCSENCLPILLEQLAGLPCPILVPMGLHPTQALLQTKIHRFADVVGKTYTVRCGGSQRLVLPIYHTSPQNPIGYRGNVAIFKQLAAIIDTLS